ncbi:ABC transporter permease [Candidatus Acetothermia bacterium]|nr:ABC transporter permease [Candidatus Acetothermia bacterium]MBI3643704.1 ABC transporter permease [Candidatus Acetothermia bacterium]
MFFNIALRNVFRNRRRTAISLGVVALGVAILYVVVGFVSASLVTTKESLARLYGSVQVASSKYFANQTKAYMHLMDQDAADRAEEILKNDPHVLGTETQLGFTGLIGNIKGSTLLTAQGYDPTNPVENFGDLIVDGTPLQDRTDPREILLGKSLADSLGLNVGDWIVVGAGTQIGNFNASAVQVVGIMKFNDLEQEGQLGFIPLAAVQKLLMTKSKIERIIVKTDNIDAAPQFARELQAKFDAAGISLQVRPWQQLSPLYASIRQFSDVFTLYTYIGVFILAFFSILEVLTMAFLERKREVGTIRAVGTRRRQVFLMFVQEGVVLGVIGGVLGVLLGFLIAALINGSSLTWLPPGTIDPVPVIIGASPLVAALAFLAALASALLGTLYPAYMNSRRNIVESLSHV